MYQWVCARNLKRGTIKPFYATVRLLLKEIYEVVDLNIPVNPLENKAVNTGPDWKKNVM